jgi:hypothetical protein
LAAPIFGSRSDTPHRRTKAPGAIQKSKPPFVEAGFSAMPTDWEARVRDAVTNLELKTDRVLEPNQSLALIDDIVAAQFAAAELATIHGVPQDAVRATLGLVTRAVGTGRSRSLEGGWYVFQGYEHPYKVAPGFAAAWKQARGLT